MLEKLLGEVWKSKTWNIIDSKYVRRLWTKHLRSYRQKDQDLKQEKSQKTGA